MGDDIHRQAGNGDDMHGALHGEQGVIGAQMHNDHGHDSKGTQILTVQTLGEDKKQMADTTTMQNNNVDTHHGQEDKGPQPIVEHILGVEHHQEADNTDLDNLYVDLRRVQEVDSKANAGDEIILPIIARNLSPRLVVPRENSMETSTHALNIDQSVAVEQDCRQVRGKEIFGYSIVVLLCVPSLRVQTSIFLIDVQNSLLPSPIIMSFVHAKCSVEERRELWFNLLNDKPNSIPWCIGDSISVLYLARHPSDHAPLKISFAARSDNKPRPFRFLNIWTTKPELLEVIHQAWNQDVDGSPLRILCSKLLATKRAIQAWNKQHFGNIFDVVRSAEDAVQRAEEAVDHDVSEECQVELSKAQVQLRHALSIEGQFWSQKARVKWLRQGDRNSKYFHAAIRQRRAQGMIHRIKKSNSDWVGTNADIASEAISYLSDLFTSSLESSSEMWHLIPSMISEEDNVKLEAVPSIDEVYRVARSMDGDSAAGPDGFAGKFFTYAWEVVAQDVYKVVLSFFCGAELPRFITSTSIMLIPKMPNPQDFSQFRPISLCNFFNKLLSRILADRVACVLPKIISPQQTGFVKGRNITENFLLAQEVISGIGKKTRDGNVVIKLDMSKAYDRVAWGHIIGILRRFGFGEIFIDLVWRLLSNVWVSVIINGSSYGTRGVSKVFETADKCGKKLLLSSFVNVTGETTGDRMYHYICLEVISHTLSKVPALFWKVQIIIFWGSMSIYSSKDYVMEIKTAFLWRQGSANQACIGINASTSDVSCSDTRKGLSLWATFMKANCCRHLHPCQVELRAMDSALWRRIVNVSRQVELSMLWVVKYRACHFLYDNWLGNGALFLRATVVPNLSFENFIINGHWDVNMLCQTLPNEMVPSILDHPVPEEGGETKVIWMSTTSGKFSLNSVFGDIRQARNTSMVFERIWHPRFPLKVSFFMLQLLVERLPESIEHLFSNGDIASEVWNYFGGACDLEFPASSLRPRIIWKARNKAMFEGAQMRSSAICHAIFSEIQSMVGIQFKQGRYILNTDDYSKGNPGVGGSGGVLRDSKGMPLIGFSAYLGETTCLHAEARALLIGLQICVHRGFGNLYVQSDFLVLVGILQHRIHCPWHIRREVRQIWKFVEDSDRFLHYYREANTVADALSNVAVSHPEQQLKIYKAFNSFPRLARGAIRLDRLGMSSIRKIKLN
ncbi:uncharacterized protein [Coffea arabica]|uniref:Reverse transcriptase domain-containing protein n=1 Tax=Coffea arabica TaxID=13443 RepID=A0ABM4VCF9_COFAR